MSRKPSGQRKRERTPAHPPAAVHVARVDDCHLVVSSPSPLTDGDRNAIVSLLGERGHRTLTRPVWVEPTPPEVQG